MSVIFRQEEANDGGVTIFRGSLLLHSWRGGGGSVKADEEPANGTRQPRLSRQHREQSPHGLSSSPAAQQHAAGAAHSGSLVGLRRRLSPPPTARSSGVFPGSSGRYRLGFLSTERRNDLHPTQSSTPPFNQTFAPGQQYTLPAHQPGAPPAPCHRGWTAYTEYRIACTTLQ